MLDLPLGKRRFQIPDDFSGSPAAKIIVAQAIFLRLDVLRKPLDFFVQLRNFLFLIDSLSIRNPQVELRCRAYRGSCRDEMPRLNLKSGEIRQPQYGIQVPSTSRRVPSSSLEKSAATFRFGSSFMSARMLRAAAIISCSVAISFSAAASAQSERGSGNWSSAIDQAPSL